MPPSRGGGLYPRHSFPTIVSHRLTNTASLPCNPDRRSVPAARPPPDPATRPRAKRPAGAPFSGWPVWRRTQPGLQQWAMIMWRPPSDRKVPRGELLAGRRKTVVDRRALDAKDGVTRLPLPCRIGTNYSVTISIDRNPTRKFPAGNFLSNSKIISMNCHLRPFAGGCESRYLSNYGKYANYRSFAKQRRV